MLGYQKASEIDIMKVKNKVELLIDRVENKFSDLLRGIERLKARQVIIHVENPVAQKPQRTPFL